MSKQTAVEWLVKMLYSPMGKGFIEGRRQIPHHIIEQAKEMEKQQIENAYRIGSVNELTYGDNKAEQYYNETYGGEK